MHLGCSDEETLIPDEVQCINNCDKCGRVLDRFWYANDPGHVHAAEAVLIARGLGHSYARALLDHLDIGIHAWCVDHADTIAHASLAARVRAMAAVVRSQP